jgi:hypothetical protein
MHSFEHKHIVRSVDFAKASSLLSFLECSEVPAEPALLYCSLSLSSFRYAAETTVPLSAFGFD